MNPGATGGPPPRTKIPGYKQYQVQNYSPGQLSLHEQIINSLLPGIQGSGDYLSKLASGDESMFDQLEAPAFANFEKLLGQIGTRFSDLGGRDSSYFENAVSGAGGELAQNLQSQRMSIRNQAIQSLLEQSGLALDRRPYENHFFPKEKKQGTDWGSVGQLGGTILGGLGGAYLGGPAGAATGAQFGGQAGKTIGGAFTR